MGSHTTAKNAMTDASSESVDSGPSSGPPTMLRTLHRHQHKASMFLRQANDLGILASVPGTGKTIVAIRRAKRCEGPRLIICRRDDFFTWNTQLQLDGIPAESILSAESAKDVQKKIDPTTWPAGVWLMLTYDMFRNDVVYDFVKAVQWSIVIADECHVIKRWKAARTKRVIRATRHIPRRISMTGSPITNEATDVFAHALFIDNGKRFGTNEWKFIQRYYIRHPGGYGWFQKRETKAEITRKLQGLMFYVGDEVIKDLPPQRRIFKAAPMTNRQQKAYDKVVTDWEIELSEHPDDVLEINHVTVQLSKLRQIAGGFFYDQDHNTHVLPCSKLDLLFDMLSDPDYLGRKPKIVIWCAFTAEIIRIAEQAAGKDINHEILYGDMATSQREAARATFRDDPTVRLFIGQVDAGVGMNELVVADTAVYYSNSYRVVSKDQSMRRIRRIGSEHHKVITYYDLVSEGTVDARIIHSINSAMSYASTILRGLKKGISIRKFVS